MYLSQITAASDWPCLFCTLGVLFCINDYINIVQPANFQLTVLLEYFDLLQWYFSGICLQNVNKILQ